MLYGSPLEHDPIDVNAELRTLADALEGSPVGLSCGLVTPDSVAAVLVRAGAPVRDVVIHIAAHCTRPDASGGARLVLERPDGRRHFWREELDALLAAYESELRSTFLISLCTCFSEDLAQIFVERGCKHVIAVRGQVLDRAARQFAKRLFMSLAGGASVLKAFEQARVRLRLDPDPDVQASAEKFVLFGQHSADRAVLGGRLESRSDADVHMAEVAEQPMTELEDAVRCLELAGAPSANQYFAGRHGELATVLECFGRHRVCVVHGGRGVGKRALAQELARFASAPGRRFSCCVAMADPKEHGSPVALVDALREVVLRLSAQHTGMQQPDGSVEALEMLPALQALERVRRRHAALIIINDRGGLVNKSEEVRSLLGELLDKTCRCHFLICSPEPLYDWLGGQRAMNLPLQGLDGRDAAKLFLRCVNRPLGPDDFPGEAKPPIKPGLELWDLLARHPLLLSLQGNPRRIRQVATKKVIPGGPSLLDLAASQTSTTSSAPRRPLGAVQNSAQKPMRV